MLTAVDYLMNCGWVNENVYIVEKLFCLDPRVNEGAVIAEGTVIVKDIIIEDGITSTNYRAELYVETVKVLDGFVVDGLIKFEYEKFALLKADSELGKIIVIKFDATEQLMLEFWKVQTPPEFTKT